MTNRTQANRKSIRLKEYDYSNAGWYYVTICTKNFIHWFGKVRASKVQLNELGLLVLRCIKDIPGHFNNSELDDFIIMPNHLHCIIILNDVVGTRDRVSLRRFGNIQKGSLSLIINQFKGSFTRFARKNGYDKFAWQSRFYEHIIRNDKDLYRIRTYINNNPLKWELDEYYTK